MNAFAAHVVKECREQRAPLLACAAILVTAAVAVPLLVPARDIPADVETWFVILALGAGLVMLGSDLVCGEVRRGQLGLLARLPGGLRVAFIAKITALFAGLVLLLALGWACGLLCGLGSGFPGPLRVSTLGSAPVAIGLVTASALMAAPWTLAVSALIPRSASVLPTTAVVLGVVVGPPVLVVVGYGMTVQPVTIALGGGFVFISGIGVAWASFVRGLRFGPGPGAARPGIVAAGLALLPLWGWTAERVWSWHHVDVRDPGARVWSALLGADGRTLFANLSRDRGPSYAVVVDLSDGSWRQLGAPRSSFTTTVPWSGTPWILDARWLPQPVVELHRSGTDAGPISLLSGNGARRLLTWSDRSPPREAAGVRARARRAVAPFRLPDGTRAWFESRSTVFEAPDGTRTVMPWPARRCPGMPAGFGFRWANPEAEQHTGSYFDLTRRATFEGPSKDRWPFGVFVRGGDWVVHAGPTKYALFDPMSGRIDPPSEPERVVQLLSDGRLVVLTAARTIELWDPALDARDVLRFADGAVARVGQVGSPSWRNWGVPVTTPSGADVLVISRDSEATVARVDGTTLLPGTWSRNEFEVVAIEDDDHVLVIADHRRIERWRFGSDDAEVLFRVGRDR